MTDKCTPSASLADLVDQRVGFCGVDDNTLCVVTDAGERLAFEAVEDECDGYRSCLQDVNAVPLDGHVFFEQPIVTLTVKESSERSFDGFLLVDENGHVWLKVGTDNYDDYYPCFTVRYDPPKGSETEVVRG